MTPEFTEYTGVCVLIADDVAQHSNEYSNAQRVDHRHVRNICVKKKEIGRGKKREHRGSTAVRHSWRFIERSEMGHVPGSYTLRMKNA